MWQRINKHRAIIHLVLGATAFLLILSPLAHAQGQSTKRDPEPVPIAADYLVHGRLAVREHSLRTARHNRIRLERGRHAPGEIGHAVMDLGADSKAHVDRRVLCLTDLRSFLDSGDHRQF